jgi:glycerophosphoryl diester phosphodiesterase
MGEMGARTLILGHRGAPAAAPENTLAAFRRALELGADGIETDVRRSADGQLPLIHDEDVARTTGDAGRVGDLPWSALAALDAGAGERIPRLEDALAWAAAARAGGAPPFLNLELKMPGVGHDVLAALARAAYRGPLALSSFDYPTLEEVRRRDGRVELWLLGGGWADDLPDRARAVAATCLALWHGGIDEDTVARATAAGLGLVAWTADEPADLRRLLALRPSPRALISNRPDLARAEWRVR